MTGGLSAPPCSHAPPTAAPVGTSLLAQQSEACPPGTEEDAGLHRSPLGSTGLPALPSRAGDVQPEYCLRTPDSPLGWAGNVDSIDDLGISLPLHTETPGLRQLVSVVVFLLGDIACGASGQVSTDGAKYTFYEYADTDLESLCVKSFKSILQNSHTEPDLFFICAAPKITSDSAFRSRGRSSRSGAALERPHLPLSDLLPVFAEVSRYPGVRAAFLHPASSRYFTALQDFELDRGGWSSLRWPACQFGGRHDTHWKIRVHGMDLPDWSTSCNQTKDYCTPRSDWPAGVGAAFQDFMVAAVRRAVAVQSARANLSLVCHGRVKRHVLRGPLAYDSKEIKRLEDLSSRAGLANPADLRLAWPELWTAMAAVRDALVLSRSRDAELQDLSEALGPSATRPPPSEGAIARARASVARVLGLSRGAAAASNPASPWKYNIVHRIQRAAGDPDEEVARWLRDGAPMGILREIQPCGLLPLKRSPAEATPQSVLLRSRKRNHASFRELHGEERAPGLKVLEDHVMKGFGVLFTDRDAAEDWLGSATASAPLGNVRKEKDDGTVKDRLISDMRANGVNSASETPERQVLPTLLHHARDLALLSQASTPKPNLFVMILDFKDAFMSVPHDPQEWAWNCCDAEASVSRGSRCPAYPGEPQEGRFVVWRVLGFGGKSNPLIFARVAAFASRTGQALFDEEVPVTCGTTLASVRLQQYVDDPIAAICGDQLGANAAVDLLIAWWLVLGIPLSWSKGMFRAISAKASHVWIGGSFPVPSPGVAEVSLLPSFISEMRGLFQPLLVSFG